MWLLFHYNQCGGSVLHRAPEAKPGSEWNAPRRRHRNIGQVEDDESEAAGLQEEIGGLEGLF